MFKSFFGLSIVSFSSLFLQLTPEAASGWEKIGVIGILIAAIIYLLRDKSTAQKELSDTIKSMNENVIATKNELAEMKKTDELVLNRLWDEKVKKQNSPQPSP
jgi:uncharacterized membrane protein (DUF106 family)